MSNAKTVSWYTTTMLVLLFGLLIFYYDISHEDCLAQVDKASKFPAYVHF